MTNEELNAMVAASVEKSMGSFTEAQKTTVETAIGEAQHKQPKDLITPLENRIQLIQDEADKKAEDGTNGFKSLGEFAQSVIKVANTQGRDMDKRLITKDAGTGMAEANGPDGGFLVPSAWSPAMMEKAMTDDFRHTGS